MLHFGVLWRIVIFFQFLEQTLLITINQNGSTFAAYCLTHRVDIYLMSKKNLTQPFVDSAAALEAAAEKDEGSKKAEFRRFVEEFGTHFATQAILRLKYYLTFY